FPPLRPRASSVAPVPLLLPWISVDVVAVRLPEAGLVGHRQPHAPHPFGALLEIEVRNEQARRAAVLRLERLAVVCERDPGLAHRQVLEWEIGRVASSTEREGW